MPLAMLLGLLGLCSAGLGAWYNLKNDVAEIPYLKAKLESHDQAMAKLDVMSNDIQWIKTELLRRQREDTIRSNR